MIGIDTNVLVRYLTQDDPHQADLATHFLEETCGLTNPGFISFVTLAELSWVLSKSYKYNKPTLLKILCNYSGALGGLQTVPAGWSGQRPSTAREAE